MTRTNFLNNESFGGNSNIYYINHERFLLCPTGSKSREKFYVEVHVKNGSICSSLDQIDFDSDCCFHLKGLKSAVPFPKRTAKIDKTTLT